VTYLKEIRPRVQAHPLFAGLSDDDVKTLAEHARPVTVASGLLFEQGGDADRFWLLESGRIALDVHVPGREPLVVEELGAGEVVGWSWLDPPHRWEFDARVLEPVHALEFEAEPIRALGEFEPQLALQLHERFLRVVVHRLKATRFRLIEMSGIDSGTGGRTAPTERESTP
jgi:CRP/FNR family transcriptional regulator, cyclic AMP receptor protein